MGFESLAKPRSGLHPDLGENLAGTFLRIHSDIQYNMLLLILNNNKQMIFLYIYTYSVQ